MTKKRETYASPDEHLSNYNSSARKQLSGLKGDQTPIKLGQLLQEENKPSVGTIDDQKSLVIDMIKAKTVMKNMSDEQQGFVEQLLTKLRQEQQMRLQSEEQNEKVMSRMVLTQK